MAGGAVGGSASINVNTIQNTVQAEVIWRASQRPDAAYGRGNQQRVDHSLHRHGQRWGGCPGRRRGGRHHRDDHSSRRGQRHATVRSSTRNRGYQAADLLAPRSQTVSITANDTALISGARAAYRWERSGPAPPSTIGAIRNRTVAEVGGRPDRGRGKRLRHHPRPTIRSIPLWWPSAAAWQRCPARSRC